MSNRHLLDDISHSLASKHAVIVSAMPHGGARIAQPSRVPEAMVRAYAREFHSHDRAAWRAITLAEPARLSDCYSAGEFEASEFFRGFLEPNLLRWSLAIPLRNPIFDGYPGAAVFFRGAEDPDFSAGELASAKSAGEKLEKAIEAGRPGRALDIAAGIDPWTHVAAGRLFIFAREGKLAFPRKFNKPDQRVEQQMHQHARAAIEHIKRGQQYSDRLLLPDARGDLWVFNCAAYREFPALGAGAFAVMSLQPECFEWLAVKPAELSADGEVGRILPTLRLMYQDYGKNLTLDDVSKKAHLSPFHFHRRFADLLGQTPKQFLLNCQIHHAKRALASRRQDLPEVALECGFAHQSHFTSRFKQAVGLTPTRWRRLAHDIICGKV